MPFALRTLAKFTLDLLFPLTCIGCGREGFLLCPRCETGIPCSTNIQCPWCHGPSLHGKTCAPCKSFSSLDGLWIAAPYTHLLVKHLIHAMKYQGMYSVRDDLERFLLPTVKRFQAVVDAPPDLLIPIPLHPARQGERGFNQAQLLAEIIALCLNVPVLPAMSRIRQTSAQAKLSRELRLKNLSGVFAITDPFAVRGKRVILVDDVATTCATLAEAAAILRQCGAQSVWGFVVARGTYQSTHGELRRIGKAAVC